ncbi:PAS domain S-box protein [Undibacterium sp. Ren11W]|uniref:PAS domain S-box protein n=1 Tax=Undibacterium sp. Ren11W TaxID=3413045 RepID=UPI003BF2FFDF
MNTSFSSRIAGYFGVLFLAAIWLLLMLWYFGFPQIGWIGARNQRLTEAIHILEVKADLQRAWIANSIKERRGSILVVSESRSLANQLESQDKNLQNNFERLFDRIERAHPDHFNHMLLVDPESGTIRASDKSIDVGRQFYDQSLIKRATQIGASEMVEQLLGPENKPAIGIVRQIHMEDSNGDHNGKLVGLLIAFLDLQNFIGEIFQEESSGFTSQERSLLFDPDRRLLAHFPAHAGSEKFIFNNQIAPGFEGTLTGKDGSDTELVEVYRSLQLNGSQVWTLVHYASKEAALGTLKENLNALAISALLLTLLALLLIRWVAHRLTRPLLALSEAAKQLGVGDLNVRATSHKSESRELVTLSDAFNSMADSIQKDHCTLADRITAGTAELRKSEKRNLIFFDATADAVILLENGTIIDCNPAALRLFGAHHRNEIIARHPSELSPAKQADGADSISAANQRVAQAMTQGMIVFEWLHLRLDTKKTFIAEVLLSRMEINGQTIIQGTIRDISERKRIEQAQQRSEAKLQATLDAIPDLLFELGLDGRYQSYHSPRVELLAAPPQELIGHLITEVLPEPAALTVMAALQQANDAGFSAGKQIALNLQQGVKWFELSVSRKTRIEKEEPSFIVLSRDITERKRIETALQESEERHRALVEWTPEAIIIHSNGKIMYANPAAIHLFEANNEQDLLGKTVLDLVHPDFHESAQVRAQSIREHGSSTPMTEEVLLKLDGTPLIAEVQSTSITYDGKLAFHTFIHDITRRKRTLAALQESEERHRVLVEWSPEGINVHRDGRLIYVNPAAIRMLGATQVEDLVGRPILDIIHPDFHHVALSRVQSISENQAQAAMMEMKFLQVNGKSIDVEAQGTSIVFDGAAAVYVAWNDISERKKNEQALRIAATAFESQEGMFVTDADRTILRINRAFSEITGYPADEIVGKTPRLLKSGIHDEAFYAAMSDSMQSTGTWQGEIWNRRKNGEVFPEWLTISGVKDSAGVTTHYVGSFIDITSRKIAENEIKNLAFYDPLTALPNRRLLLDRLEQALAAGTRHQRKGALLFVDLDNFKTLNDTLGHDKGDLLLKQVASRLTDCTREGDTVARLGGDEFVVMLENLSESALDAATQAEAVGEKILYALNQIYHLGHCEHRSTPSIGITLFGEHAESIDEPLKRADLAMYEAKAAGRNTLRFFDPQMQSAVATRASLETDLREAIVKKQFQLYYQAQVTSDNSISGVEVLLRWQHPLRGMIYPADFIPLAEHTGLILDLGAWVIDSACEQLACWSQQVNMAQLTIAVNVSPNQFHQANFVPQVLDALARSGANPLLLKLELTETLLIKNVEELIVKMRILKQHGVGFSLDDFGTGYSSLSYLKRLPLDQLKIDQSFVKDILFDSNDSSIAKMIIVLAESLGLAVIAEGVETEEQRSYLATQGCQAYQGYLFSRPLPLVDFENLMKNQTSLSI